MFATKSYLAGKWLNNFTKVLYLQKPHQLHILHIFQKITMVAEHIKVCFLAEKWHYQVAKYINRDCTFSCVPTLLLSPKLKH